MRYKTPCWQAGDGKRGDCARLLDFSRAAKTVFRVTAKLGLSVSIAAETRNLKQMQINRSSRCGRKEKKEKRRRIRKVAISLATILLQLILLRLSALRESMHHYSLRCVLILLARCIAFSFTFYSSEFYRTFRTARRNGYSNARIIIPNPN